MSTPLVVLLSSQPGRADVGLRALGAAAGFAVADRAVTIDLRRMDAVHVDPSRRLLRVQGGATWRDVDAARRRTASP